MQFGDKVPTSMFNNRTTAVEAIIPFLLSCESTSEIGGSLCFFSNLGSKQKGKVKNFLSKERSKQGVILGGCCTLEGHHDRFRVMNCFPDSSQ